MKDGETRVPLVVDDRDLISLMPMREVVRTIEAALLAHAEGSLHAQPRLKVPVQAGALAINAGSDTTAAHAVGFSATFWAEEGPRRQEDEQKLVVVFDSQSGALRGVVVGAPLMDSRTGAIGGVAVKYLSRPNAARVGILGSGPQARLQVEAIGVVREIASVKVFSPNPEHRERFALEIRAKLGLPVEAVAQAREAVSTADILVCATNAGAPVLEAAWLRPGTHINILGPNYKERHDLPTDAVERCAVIATDSLAQVDAHKGPFGTYFLVGTSHRSRMVELGQIVAGRAPGRGSADDITLFSSIGLGGTEVAVANEALRRYSLVNDAESVPRAP